MKCQLVHSWSLIAALTFQFQNTVEPPISGHPQDQKRCLYVAGNMTKCPLTRGVCLREVEVRVYVINIWQSRSTFHGYIVPLIDDFMLFCSHNNPQLICLFSRISKPGFWTMSCFDFPEFPWPIKTLTSQYGIFQLNTNLCNIFFVRNNTHTRWRLIVYTHYISERKKHLPWPSARYYMLWKMWKFIVVCNNDPWL